MTDATTIENQTTARLVELSKQFPEIQVQQITDDTIRLTVADRETLIFVDYFRVENVQNGNDTWRYFISHQTEQTKFAGQFSHPTEQGCWIMAKKYFSENGCIEIPTGNTHLSEIDRDRMASAQIVRNRCRTLLFTTPQVGDVVVDLEGNERRICASYDEDCQTTTAMERDYYTDSDGLAHFGGGLGQKVAFTDLVRAEEARRVLFWSSKAGEAEQVEKWSFG